MAGPLETICKEVKNLTENVGPVAALMEIVELSEDAAHKLSPERRAKKEIDKLLLKHKPELDKLQKEAEEIIEDAVKNLNPNEKFLQHPSNINDRPVVLRETAMKLYIIAQKMAKILGCELSPTSSYRSVNYQEFIWDKKFKTCKNKWKKLSEKTKISMISNWENNPKIKKMSRRERNKKIKEWELSDKAITRWTRSYVAPPGGSPHHTGGAIDIGGKKYLGIDSKSKEYSSAIKASKAPKTFKKLMLREIMTRAGFENYEAEPWHWEVFTHRWAHHKTYPFFSWQSKWEKPLWKGKSTKDEPSWSKLLRENLGQPTCPVYKNKKALYNQEYYYGRKIPYTKTGDVEKREDLPEYREPTLKNMAKEVLALIDTGTKQAPSKQDPLKPTLVKSPEKIIDTPSKLTQKAVDDFEHIFTSECPSTKDKCYYFLSPDREIMSDNGPERVYYRISSGKGQKKDLLDRKKKLKQRNGKDDNPDWDDWDKAPYTNLYSKRNAVENCLKNIKKLEEEYPDTSIIQDIEDKFAEEFYTSPLGKMFNDKSVHKYLIHGLIVLESMYDPKAISGVEALGLWQLMPDVAKEVGLKVADKKTLDKALKEKSFKELIEIDERIDPVKSTKAAVLSLNKNFEYFSKAKTKKGEPVLDYLIATYNLSPEDIILPLMIDSHHSGMGNIRRMIKWFADTYSKTEIQEVYGNGPYGQDIYFLMSKLYEKTHRVKGSKNKSYGPKCRDYYLKAMAMHEGLSKKTINDTGERTSRYLRQIGRDFLKKGRFAMAKQTSTSQKTLESLANDFDHDLKLIEILFNNKNFPKESLHNFAYHKSEEVRELLAKSPYAWEATYAVIASNEKSEKVIKALAKNKKCPGSVLATIYHKYHDEKYIDILHELAGNIATPQSIIDEMWQRKLFRQ